MSKNIIISYPRSGSNFLQNVASKSLPLSASSIYDLSGARNPTKYDILKSHALNHDWLADEFSRFGLRSVGEYRVVWLVRDLRDVFVSFHNFVESRKGVKIDTSSFLDEVSFEYALEYGAARYFDRRVELAPRSVWQFYLEHVQFWMQYMDARREGEGASFRYEDLLDVDSIEWGRLFELLRGRRIKPKPGILRQRVSTYDDRERPRGIERSWDYEGSTYREFCSVLLDRCNDSIPDFMSKFSYV